MICSYCSAEMPEISMFCPGCGRAVKPADSEATVSIAASSRSDSLIAAVSYASPIPAILFLAIPGLKFNNSAFVRFHSWQSILFSVATIIVGFLVRLVFAILSFIPWVGFLFAWLSIGVVSLAVVILWIVLVVKAAQGEAYELPKLGSMALHLAERRRTA